MGGNVPLGYAAHGRTLAIAEEDAKVVRDIYAIYEATGNLRSAKREIDRKGYRTAVRRRADGGQGAGCRSV